jgi:hypothetical protein
MTTVKKSNPFGYSNAIEKFISNEYIEYFWKDNPAKTAPYDYVVLHLERYMSAVGYWGGGITSYDSTGSSIFDQRTKKYLPLPANQLWVNVSGYPLDKGKGNRQYLAYNKAVRLNAEGNMLYYENDTYHGHSGSPVWIKRSSDNGGRILIGIHKGSGDIDLNRNRRITNRAVFISESAKNFIHWNRL